MAPQKFSQYPPLRLTATALGTIFVGFGINAILRPVNALSFFELGPLAATANQDLIDALMVVYGVRDIFMGLAIYAAAYYKNTKALGLILIAGSAVAFTDGYVCKAYVGTGEMNHWGYAPILTVLGTLLLGILD